MKQFTFLKRACVLAVMVLAGLFTASAADFMVDSICYNIIGDNEVEVTSRDPKYSGDVVIPATVTMDGVVYQVTRIGRQSFYKCVDMTSVEIPEGVTSIGYYAFVDCDRIEMPELPNSLISIDGEAFGYCDNITSVYIPRNVATIAPFAFYGCDITDFICSTRNQYYKTVNGVLYSKDMTRLEVYPRASAGTTFDIPSTVEIIQSGAFSGADKLTEITLPESVIWIGASAFRNCDAMESIYIPDGVQHIGPSGFYNCDILSDIHLPASLDTICNALCSNLPALVELTVPSNVKYIDDFAFAESDALKDINFEEGSNLLAIGLRAFENCIGLEHFEMPNSVTMLEGQIFGYCTGLKSVHLSDNLTNMDSSTFWGCSALTECEIPGGVQSIQNVFVNCASLKKVKIGNKYSTPGVTTIKNVGIGDCEQLEYIELGANVDSLATGAIIDIDSLKFLICWAATPPRCHYYWSSFWPYPDKLNATLYVPKASLEAYSTAYDWKDFRTIVAIEDVGDINHDGLINVTDVTALIGILLGNDASLHSPLTDVNFDGKTTVSDVTKLISLVLSGNPPLKAD